MTDLASQLAESFVNSISTNDTLRDSLLSALSIPGQLSNQDTKSTKQESNYRRADSSTDKRKTQSPRCGTCDHFIQHPTREYQASADYKSSPEVDDKLPGRCELVAGRIDANYVCDMYEPG